MCLLAEMRFIFVDVLNMRQRNESKVGDVDEVVGEVAWRQKGTGVGGCWKSTQRIVSAYNVPVVRMFSGVEFFFVPRVIEVVIVDVDGASYVGPLSPRVKYI